MADTATQLDEAFDRVTQLVDSYRRDAVFRAPEDRGDVMALKVVCIACFDGDHANHRRVVRPAPRDGVGGDICDCQGECAANGVAACSTFDCNRPAVTNGRCENCERIVSLLRPVTDQTKEAE